MKRRKLINQNAFPKTPKAVRQLKKRAEKRKARDETKKETEFCEFRGFVLPCVA